MRDHLKYRTTLNVFVHISHLDYIFETEISIYAVSIFFDFFHSFPLGANAFKFSQENLFPDKVFMQGHDFSQYHKYCGISQYLSVIMVIQYLHSNQTFSWTLGLKYLGQHWIR